MLNFQIWEWRIIITVVCLCIWQFYFVMLMIFTEGRWLTNEEVLWHNFDEVLSVFVK
jgi:hypothetical protein